MTGWWLLAFGCSTSAPVVSGVPEGAVRLVATADAITVEGRAVEALGTNPDPRRNVDDSLTAALQPHAGRPVWIEMPPDSAFVAVRRLVNAAREAGMGRIVLSARGDDHAQPLGDAPRYGLAGTCPDGPRKVVGAAPLITLSIQRGPEGTWLVGTARFLPEVAGSDGTKPVDGLPQSCLDVPACDELYAASPALAAACREGEGGAEAPVRVALGGPSGCLAPVSATPEAVSSWPDAVEARVKELGLLDQPLSVVMPEARVRQDALMAVLEGFRRGRPQAGVAVGTTLLIEGNDGPPTCDAKVRDAGSLAAAGARWLGSLRTAQD